MIRPLTPAERRIWNLEQPGARVSACLAEENGPWEYFRQATIRLRATEARRRATRRPTTIFFGSQVTAETFDAQLSEATKGRG